MNVNNRAWLDRKYLNIISSRLSRFKWKSHDHANHRCPLCGDSQKSLVKARGNHFVHKGSFVYKCHNCGAAMSSASFIKIIDPSLFDEYRFELFTLSDDHSIKPKESKEKKLQYNQSSGLNDFVKVINKKKDSVVSDIMDRCDKLKDDHDAIKYLKSRNIPENRYKDIYYIDDMSKFKDVYPDLQENSGCVAGDKRLVFPTFNRKGDIVGYTCRTLDPRNPKRYIIVKVKEDENLIFGYDKVDLNKPIIVVEGPVDSLFLSNCVATNGANLKIITDYLPIDKSILVFDNQPRNKSLCKIISRAIEQGLTVSLLPSGLPGKDINQMIQSGMTSKEIEDMIFSNASKGLEAKIKFEYWRKV